MIVCLALNPTIEKTCIVEDIEVDQNNLIIDQSMNIGGEEIDCARIIKVLQGEPNVLGFIAGLNGRYIKNSLDKNKIKSDFIILNGDTRLKTIIIDPIKGNKLVFYDDGIHVQEKDSLRLRQEYNALIKDSSVVLITGEPHKGISVNQYTEMIHTAKKYTTKPILATSDEVLRKGVAASPYGIVLNSRTIKDLGIGSEDSHKIIKDLYHIMLENKIHYIAYDMSEKGAYILSKNKVIYAKPIIEIEPIKAQGSKSSFIGAFAIGVERKYQLEKMSKIAVAASLSNMINEDNDIICKKSTIDYLSKKIKVLEVMNKSRGWVL